MSNKIKGQLLEDLVAKMHEIPGVKVETRVKLPVRNSSPEIMREFDVLLTAFAAGYKIHLAFSCKNEIKKVQISDVDSFAQALQQVGVPAQQAFIVCINGATKDAKVTAKQHGIKILKYFGLDENRMAEKIEAAIQTQLYYLLEGIQFDFFSYVPDTPNEFLSNTVLTMDEPRGELGLAILECLHKHWVSSIIQAKIGKQTLLIRPNNDEQNWQVIVDINIVGLMGRLSGKAKRRALIDCDSDTIEKLSVRAEFDQQEENLILSRIETEQLVDEINHENPLHLVNRVRVPRISWNGLYWPITKVEYDKLMQAKAEGSPIKLSESYLANLNNAWLK